MFQSSASTQYSQISLALYQPIRTLLTERAVRGRTGELSVKGLGFSWHSQNLICLSSDLIWTRTNAADWILLCMG